MKVKLAFMLMACMCLVGCAAPEANYKDWKPDSPNEYVSGQQSSSDTGSFGTDNKYTWDETKIESSKLDSSELEEPYHYLGKTYSENQDTKEAQSSTGLEDFNSDSDSFEYDVGDDGTIDDTVVEDVPQILDERSAILKSIYEVDRTVKNNIWLSGISVLNSTESEQDFNKSHSVSMTAYISQLKNALSAIEYEDSIIQTDFTDDKYLISSWLELKEILIEWRDKLANVNTGEQFIKSGLQVDGEQIKLFNDFSNRLDSFRNLKEGEVG